MTIQMIYQRAGNHFKLNFMLFMYTYILHIPVRTMMPMYKSVQTRLAIHFSEI